MPSRLGKPPNVRFCELRTAGAESRGPRQGPAAGPLSPASFRKGLPALAAGLIGPTEVSGKGAKGVKGVAKGVRLLRLLDLGNRLWIGKEAVVNHHQQVPFHLPRDVPDSGCQMWDLGAEASPVGTMAAVSTIRITARCGARVR